MKTLFQALVIIVLLKGVIGCSPAPFLTIGDENTNSDLRSKDKVLSKFNDTKRDIFECLVTNDTIIPIGQTRDLLFVNMPTGLFFLSRISEPRDHNNSFKFPINVFDCIKRVNWNDSISERTPTTIIYTRMTRITQDSINMDTLVIKYSTSPGRTKKSIMDVVLPNAPKLKAAYNRKIALGFKGTGKVTIKFAIDEHGKVIFSKVIESTLNNLELENEIESIIWKWKFPKIFKPGDVTEVVYPFIFPF